MARNTYRCPPLAALLLAPCLFIAHPALALSSKAKEVLGDIYVCLVAKKQKKAAAALYKKYQSTPALVFRHATLLEDGFLLPKDEQQALALYRKAVRKRYPAASYSYASLAKRTALVIPNRNQVVLQYLTRAAKAGDRDAMYSIAWRALAGTDAAQEVSVAQKWFLRSARQGNADAAWMLATINAHDTYGIRNRTRALAWAMVSTQIREISLGHANARLPASAAAQVAAWNKTLRPSSKKKAAIIAAKEIRKIKPEHSFLPMACDQPYEAYGDEAFGIDR